MIVLWITLAYVGFGLAWYAFDRYMQPLKFSWAMEDFWFHFFVVMLFWWLMLFISLSAWRQGKNPWDIEPEKIGRTPT